MPMCEHWDFAQTTGDYVSFIFPDKLADGYRAEEGGVDAMLLNAGVDQTLLET